ncbi:WD40 repeat-like protein [Cystobasidium minutum MCA 4210]|uniref:WD40 repeat-like protein n=1 Tax=Cystobasidium minutum MCA 4210 TaxID=1397322 RepID=UPI0034CF2E85|eukprot:jgi/Rhomi1/87069/CE87068_476
MSRQNSHFHVGVDFPVYALAWLDDDRVAVTGGGGAGRSGIKNSLSVYKVNGSSQTCDRVQELDLARDEDASSTIAVNPKKKEIVLGINSNADTMSKGTNNNVRLFSYSDDALKQEKSASTIDTKDTEIYQKVTAYSPDGSMIAVGSSQSQLSILSASTLERILPDLSFDKDEMFDADFSSDSKMFLGASEHKINVWPVSESSSATDSPPEPIQVIQQPVLSKSLKCTFRAARFGRGDNASRLFTVVNALPSGSAAGSASRRNKGERKAFISVWDVDTWKLIRTRTVAKKPVTSFDVSPDGKLLALGGSDLSITIFDAETVQPLLSVLKAHDFPSTCLRFSPDSKLLISGSADNTLRIVLADQASHPTRYRGLQAALLTLIVLLIAILIQLYAGDQVLTVARKHLHL